MAARDALPVAARPAASMNELIEESLNRLSRWVESRQYRAYDPGDGQMSFLRTLTFGSQTLERVLTATVLCSSSTFAPCLGSNLTPRPRGWATWPGVIFDASRRLGPAPRPEREDVPRLVAGPPSPGYADLCWGNEFTFTIRAGWIPQAEPTIVWSGLIGQAFVDAFEILGDPRYLEAANSTCN